MSDLPRSVDLVAKTPKLDVVRFISTGVLPPQVGPVGVSSSVAVLQPRQSFFIRTRTHVQAEVRLDAQRTGIVDEFVRSKHVGFRGEPGEFNTLRSSSNWANAVLPVVVGDKVAAWPSKNGSLELTILGDDLHDILPPSETALLDAFAILLFEKICR